MLGMPNILLPVLTCRHGHIPGAAGTSGLTNDRFLHHYYQLYIVFVSFVLFCELRLLV